MSPTTSALLSLVLVSGPRIVAPLREAYDRLGVKIRLTTIGNTDEALTFLAQQRPDETDCILLNTVDSAPLAELVDKALQQGRSSAPVLRLVTREELLSHAASTQSITSRMPFPEDSGDFDWVALRMLASIERNRRLREQQASSDAAKRKVELFSRVLDSYADAIFVKDYEGRFLYVNTMMALFHGTQASHMIGLREQDLYPDQQERARKYLEEDREVLRTGMPLVVGEHKIHGRGGAEWWVTTMKRPIADDNGQLRWVLGVITDTTARRRAESEREAMRRLAQRLTMPIRSTQLGLVVTDEARHLFHQDVCRLDLIDPATGQLVCVHYDEVGEEPLTPVPPGSGETSGQFAQVLAPLPALPAEVVEGQPRLLNPTQQEEPIPPAGERKARRHTRSRVFAPIRWKGRTLGVVSVQSYTTSRYGTHDLELLISFADQLSGAVTRVQTEQAVEHVHALYRSVIETSLGYPYRLDLVDQRYEFVAAGCAELLGLHPGNWTLAEVRARAIEHRIPSADEAQLDHEQYWQEFLRGKRAIYQADVRMTSSGPHPRWISDTAVPIRDPAHGNVVGALGIFQDVSSRKRREREQEVLARLGTRLAAAPSVESMVDVVREETDELFGWDAHYLAIRQPHEATFHVVSIYDTIDGAKQSFPKRDWRVAKMDGPLRTVLSGQPVLMNRRNMTGKENWGRFGNESRPSASLIYVPVMSGQEVIGVVTVQSYTEGRYDEQDVAALQSMTLAIAPALERAYAEEARRSSEQRYALAVRGANDGIWDWDLSTSSIFFSPRWKAMLGYDENDLLLARSEWFNRVHPDDLEALQLHISSHLKGVTSHLEFEHRVMHRDGTYRWLLVRGLAVRDEEGRATRIAGSMTDITERKNAEEQLLHDALHDALTGLPNRTLFLDRLQQAHNLASRNLQEYAFAVLFLDLDRFKLVNDSLGHQAGDELLKEVARRLKECIQPGDSVARLGGDEFTLILEGVRRAEDAEQRASEILKAFSSPLEIHGNELYTTVSIGIALSQAGYPHPEDMLRDADTAMYGAKAQGRARYQVFDRTMHDSAVATLRLDTDLRRALERGEFLLHYHPIVRADSHRILGFEALLRWQHPQRGLLNPAAFLRVAEDTGLILPIGNWVLQTAISQMRDWVRAGVFPPGGSLNVNVHSEHFQQVGFVDVMQRMLEEAELPRNSLRLEITESALLRNTASVIEVLEELRRLGVALAIDDFGTGYSSLSYLTQFPADTVKIDRSFVSRIEDVGGTLDVVKTIIVLARSLRMEVVAEGIETESLLRRVTELGCDRVQGNYFSMPVGVEEATRLLTAIPAW